MRRLARIGIALAALALAAPASASDYAKVLNAYRSNGSIPPCTFSSQQLDHALKGVDTYGEQYFGDFTAAIQNALDLRAAGACTGSTTRGLIGAAQATGAGSPLKLGPLTGASNASLPAPLVIMAVIALLAILAASVTGIVWWRGAEPRWAAAWGHAWGEAADRAGDTWSELADWARNGPE